MRIVFMGTPEIAAGMLEAIAAEHEICGVVCQPDKPVGRKAVITPPPVKVTAERLGIRVYQPTKLKDGTAEKLIRSLEPQLAVVVAYGRLLPAQLLSIPPLGCVNIHVSRLPKYRGAAPIQHALLNGETSTGVTAMFMDEGLDTGDIIEVSEFDIYDDDNAETVFKRAEKIGTELLLKTLRDIENGRAARIAQNHDEATFAPPITKEAGSFSFSDGADAIVNKTRAFFIWPNAFFRRGGKTVKLLRAKARASAGAFGRVLSTDPLVVAADGGAVELIEVKPEGGRLMSGKEWAMGQRLRVGDIIYTED